MKANFKLTVIGRISASFNEPISISRKEFKELVEGVFFDTELEHQSYEQYTKDIVELGEMYSIENPESLKDIIPELTKP